MGTSLLVISSMAAFAAFLTIFAALSTAMPMNDMYECCKEKTVGGTMYYKVDGMVDPKAYNCINGCVYVQESGPQKFCFAKGDLPVECNDGPGMSPKPPKPTDGGMSPKPPKPTDGGMPGMITTGEMPPFTDDGPFTDGGMPGMSPTGGMPGMSTMDEGMKPTEGAPGGDPSTGGPTKDYTPIFTCEGNQISTQSTGNQDEIKIVCRDNGGTIIKEAVVKCKEPQSDTTGTEGKVYCCPDCPPMPTMNMDFPTFDFGN